MMLRGELGNDEKSANEYLSTTCLTQLRVRAGRCVSAACETSSSMIGSCRAYVSGSYARLIGADATRYDCVRWRATARRF